VRDFVGFEDIPDVNTAAEVALDVVTERLSSDIRTPFLRVAYTDDFMVPRSLKTGGKYSTTLRLTSGFVTATPAYTVVTAGEHADLSTPGLTVDIKKYAVLDSDRGVLTILDEDVGGRYVRVAYTAGFAADQNDPGRFDASEVPPWLDTAAAVWASMELYNNPLFSSEDSKVPLDQLKVLAESLLRRYARSEPLAIKPL